jgi:hypothetical protein
MATISEEAYRTCIEEAELNLEVARSDPDYGNNEFFSFPFYYTIIDGEARIRNVETEMTYRGLTYPTWQLEGAIISQAFAEKPVVLVDHVPVEEKPAPKVPKPVIIEVEETEEQRKKRARGLELMRTFTMPLLRSYEHEIMAGPTEEDLDGRELIIRKETLPLEIDFLDFAKLDLELLEEADKLEFRGGSRAIPNVRVGPFLFVWEGTRARSEFADGLYICWVDPDSEQTINGAKVAGFGGFGVYGLKCFLGSGMIEDLKSFKPDIKEYRLHLYRN